MLQMQLCCVEIDGHELIFPSFSDCPRLYRRRYSQLAGSRVGVVRLAKKLLELRGQLLHRRIACNFHVAFVA